MSKLTAIDNYLIWEICKKRGIQRKIREGTKDQEQLKEEFVEKVKRQYQEKDYSLEEKKEKVKELDSNPEYRINVFKKRSWSKEIVRVRDLGTTLPHLGDLPPEVITGSLLEVVDFVRDADPEEYQSVKYINSLKKVPKILDEFYPWVTPGDRIGKIDRMNIAHGERGWNIEDTWGMINDGNHRTIAKILSGNSREIECYVGYRQD